MEGWHANPRVTAKPIDFEGEERGERSYASSRQQQHEPGPERATLLATRQIETGCVLLITAFRCTTQTCDSQPLQRENHENCKDLTLAFCRKRTALHTALTEAIATTIQPALNIGSQPWSRVRSVFTLLESFG